MAEKAPKPAHTALESASPPLGTPGKCARCRAAVRLEPLCIEIATVFTRALANRQEPGLTTGNVALCDPCYGRWQAEGYADSLDRLDRDAQLYREMRSLRAEGVSRAHGEAWVDATPDDFRAEHRGTIAHWLSELSTQSVKAEWTK